MPTKTIHATPTKRVSPTTSFVLQAANTKYPSESCQHTGDYRYVIERFVTWSFTQPEDSEFMVSIKHRRKLPT